MKGAGGNIPNAKTPGRNGAIDAAKAMAFFLVVLGHLIQIHSQPSRFIFAFHMPAFFFLSGYTYREKGFRELAAKKLRGLMLPYAGFALAGLVVTLAMGERPAPRELLYQVFYKMQPDHPCRTALVPACGADDDTALLARAAARAGEEAPCPRGDIRRRDRGGGRCRGVLYL